MDPADRKLSIDIIAAVREAVGPDIQIMIEGHRRFSVSEAIWIGEAIAEYAPTWFEEPTDHTKIDATAEVGAPDRGAGLRPARASRPPTSSPSC